MYIDLTEFEVDDRYWAHTPNETLSEHLNKTKFYLQKVLDEKKIETLIDLLIAQVDSEYRLLIKEMFLNAVYLHDLGKKNPCFQAKKMHNPSFANFEKCSDTSHSHQGALEYITYFLNKIKSIEDDNEYYRLVYILYGFAYEIEKHHGRLGDFQSFLSGEKDKHIAFTNAKRSDIKYIEDEFALYILNKLLFSLLISSDYYATIDYMANFKTDFFGVISHKKKKLLRKVFNEFISQFPKPEGINVLRKEMFNEAEENLLKNFHKNIFYLEAPTGSGKTITSINLALKLLEKENNINKIFYIFPFNTLVEQTKRVIEEVFNETLNFQVINSVTPFPKPNQEEVETQYEKSYMDRLFYHAEMVITTHVRLFDILFGTSKEDNFPLWQLANSVVIIDEIQSYNNALWWYMIAFFEKYARALNIKIVIMSATLPKLDYFLKEKQGFVSLIERRDYYYNSPFFKDRVCVDFSMLEEGKVDFERLEKVLHKQYPHYKKILFEFIKKQSAREFYERIKEQYPNVYELSGDDNKAYRQYVINKTKEEIPMIVIATQVIEAGVDIDMDLGFKDISTLDSEEQFMGRINRSCKKVGSKVYFFDMDDAANIYRGDHRVQFDLKKEKYRKILLSKSYHQFYEPVLQSIEKSVLRYDEGLHSNIENFYGYIYRLNYQNIAKTMTLIDSQNFTLYFPFKIDISKYKGVAEFEEINDKFLTNGMLDGQKVWERYLALNEIESFTKKEFERSHINALMQFFTFNIMKYRDNDRPCIGEEIGGYYYIEDYEPYITEDGKFDRVAYNEKCNGIFL